MDYSLPIAPVTKPRMTQRDRWKQRPAVIRYHQFKDDLRPYGIKLEPSLKVTFYVPMPNSWSNKKKIAMQGTPHQQKPDIDNLVKALFDAVCEDDSYIYDVRATKIWSTVGSIEIKQQSLYNSEK